MTPNVYQELARKTRCPQSTVLDDFKEEYPISLLKNHPDQNKPQIVTYDQSAMFMHSVIGLSSEIGELSAETQRFVWYKQPLNVTNLKEELGDIMWYVSEMCDALNLKLEDVMEANIAKLKKRYPDNFSNTLALEENRDREQEAQTVRKTIAQDDGVCYE